MISLRQEVIQVELKLAIQSARITGVHQHAWLLF